MNANKKYMELKDIAAVSGKPGLFRVIKPTRGGLVLESLDEQKQRLMTGPQNRVSLLHEISVYTEQIDKTIPFSEIFSKIKSEFGDDPGVDAKSDPDELKAFLAHIVPDYDRDKVYVSDMKKMVSWYVILLKNAPELLETADKAEDSAEPKAEENPVSEKKTAAKKPTTEKKTTKKTPKKAD
ncbi:MAG: DUF5606 domain-containing protein [Cyclobacteriaceae bacterium]|nr:DUF5606 domain-containing protein [Cyclobacteriaceae bacterium]